MRFIYKVLAYLVHPYNRPELAGNLTLISLALLYLIISVVTTRPSNSQSKQFSNSSRPITIEIDGKQENPHLLKVKQELSFNLQ